MTRRRVLRALAALGGCAIVPSNADARTLNGFDLRDALVPIDAIESGGPPRDGIPAIDRPRFVAPATAGLAATDRVLGFARERIARAYPIRILNWHEVVNDRIGPDPVAITYCPLCGTGMAFAARVVGRETTFGVSGLLYNSDVLLYDRDTESLWSQIMARAVTGARKGTQLAELPLSHTTFGDWLARHPRSEVLSTETGYARDYDRDPYAAYGGVPRLMFDVQHRDERLPVKAWVLGLRRNGEAKAYPLATLDRRLGARGRLPDTLGGEAVEIRYDRAHRSAEAFDRAGRLLPGVMAFWFAWVAFHPQTGLLAVR